MKKFLLSLSLCFVALAAMAQTYTENISVTVNGIKADQGKKEIQVERKADGTCTFILPNFVMADATSEVPVGTIRLDSVAMTKLYRADSIATTQNLAILPGDKPGMTEGDWVGPMLGEVPIDLKGAMTKDRLSAHININFVAMGMVIEVAVGDSAFALPEAPVEVKNFNEALSVTVNGIKADQGKKDIKVELMADGTCNFILPNFIMADATSEVPVGTIQLDSVKMTKLYAGDSIATMQNLAILPGDKPGMSDGDWLGPMLGEVPIDLKGAMTKDRLSAHININFVAMGMVIEVAVGDSTFVLPEAPVAVKNFNEELSVTVNGIKADQGKKDIKVELMADGTCNFVLPNFIMADATSEVPVGTIRLEKVEMTKCAAGDSIATKQNLAILPGDKPGMSDGDWLGPMLGEVPIDLKGLLTADRLSAQININFVAMGMVIEVTVGEVAPETAIESVLSSRPISTAVYNLNGVRVADRWNNNLPKGVYVVNGKKVIK